MSEYYPVQNLFDRMPPETQRAIKEEAAALVAQIRSGAPSGVAESGPEWDVAAEAQVKPE